MTFVLFWDIDGTLLSTARAGVLALEDAAREVCGGEADFRDLDTAGLTDHAIAAKALETRGCEPTADRVAAFVEVYETRLPDRLPERRGSVLPGVPEALEHLGRRPDVLQLLLTGNTPAGARAKLRHYGLGEAISGGAFSADGDSRAQIARRAVGVAAGRLGETPEPTRTYVIGDTPHDVACGRAIGARTVAVATGEYGLEELEALEPWLALRALPAPGELAGRLGLPETSTAAGVEPRDVRL